jgi:hypothetical protein
MLSRRRGAVALTLLFGAMAAACRAPDTAPAMAEAAYLAARDSAIRSLLQRTEKRDTARLHFVVDSAGDALEVMLRSIVGPFRANGFRDSATANRTLYPDDLESRLLDGLRYESAAGRGTVVVTTRSLVEAWLRDTVHRGPSIASDPLVALANDDIYYQIFGGGAAFYHFADLPVAEPVKRGIVAARLVRRAQDIGSQTPDEIVVAISRGTRMFFAMVPTTATMPPLPACVAGQGSPDERDLMYRRCYGKTIVSDSLFSVVVTQASKLASSLPVR